MSELFDRLINSEKYKMLLEKLPEDERQIVIKSLREFTEKFENNLLVPLRNLKNK